jgi:hypothetical protein
MVAMDGVRNDITVFPSAFVMARSPLPIVSTPTMASNRAGI